MKNNLMETINLKYKFKELIEFIDNMNFSLGIINKVNVSIFYTNINDKLQKRKILLENSLIKLFLNGNLIKSQEWLNILHLNKAHKNYVDKQNLLMRQQSNSLRPSLISLRPSVISRYNY